MQEVLILALALLLGGFFLRWRVNKREEENVYKIATTLCGPSVQSLRGNKEVLMTAVEEYIERLGYDVGAAAIQQERGRIREVDPATQAQLDEAMRKAKEPWASAQKVLRDSRESWGYVEGVVAYWPNWHEMEPYVSWSRKVHASWKCLSSPKSFSSSRARPSRD